VVAAAPPPQAQQQPPAKLDTRANAANGVIVAGGLLTLGGIGCFVGAWTTSQAVQDPAISYQQLVDLGSRGRALNAAGLGLTIAGGRCADRWYGVASRNSKAREVGKIGVRLR
jgi:hypothetical protein